MNIQEFLRRKPNGKWECDCGVCNGYSREKFQKYKLKDLFPDVYNKNKSERQIMREVGYYRIYDCGNMVFTYER